MRNQAKSTERVKLEEKVQHANDPLDQIDILVGRKAEPPAPTTEKPVRKTTPIRRIAWGVLILVVALAILPAIGTAWSLFFFGLSLYIWQGFVGLTVVLGILAALWAIWVLVFKD
ncbi:MAG: hypothetical protein AAF629_20845 [Chloroflexota bacterium]